MSPFQLSLAGFLFSCCGLAFCLWVMFAKANRPITWTKFNFMMGAAFLNIFGIGLNAYAMWRLWA
jgi:hypothetical protein